LEAVLDSTCKVAHAFLDVANHAFVGLLLALGLDRLLFQPLGRVMIFRSDVDLLASQGSSSLLHHGLGPCLQAIRLRHGASETGTNNRSAAAGVRLGILEAEELKSCLHDRL